MAQLARIPEGQLSLTQPPLTLINLYPFSHGFGTQLQIEKVIWGENKYHTNLPADRVNSKHKIRVQSFINHRFRCYIQT